MPIPSAEVPSRPSNPYSPPITNEPPPGALASSGATAEAELIRRTHLNHEASVKAVGGLYLLSAIGSLVMAVRAVVALAMGGPVGMVETLITVGVALPLGGVHFVVGLGLRRMRKWVKIPVGIIAGLGLFAFPIGTLINAYILYLIFCAKGAMVLSEQYAEIVRQTAHIKYKTSIVAWIFLGLLVLVVGATVVSALF